MSASSQKRIFRKSILVPLHVSHEDVHWLLHHHPWRELFNEAFSRNYEPLSEKTPPSTNQTFSENRKFIWHLNSQYGKTLQLRSWWFYYQSIPFGWVLFILVTARFDWCLLSSHQGQTVDGQRKLTKSNSRFPILHTTESSLSMAAIISEIKTWHWDNVA